jgi:hypothetical protein
VKQAREGNRAAIAAVRSLTCRFGYDVVAEAAPGVAARSNWLPSGQFWRDGSTARARVSYVRRPGIPSPIVDLLLQDDTCLYLRILEVDGRPTGRSLEIYHNNWLLHGDVWLYCLFTHYYGGPASFEHLPLDQILARPHEIWQARWVNDGGHRLLHLEVVHPTARLGFWLDPALNYLVRKSTFTPWDLAAGLRPENRQVLDVARSGDGAILPVQVREQGFEGTQQLYEVRMTLSDVKFNDPFPRDALRIPGIAGLTCIDPNRKTKFVVDADGRPAGRETPLQEPTGLVGAGAESFPVVPLPPPTPAGPAPPPDSPPQPKSRWITIIAAVLVAAGAAYYARRRSRR